MLVLYCPPTTLPENQPTTNCPNRSCSILSTQAKTPHCVERRDHSIARRRPIIMRQANLMLHTGSKTVSRGQLATVSTPSATPSWHPIAHHDFLDGVASTLARAGMHIVHESHGLSTDRNRYFGLLQITNGSNPDDFSVVLGLRNSHDKKFPLGLVVGASVMVCDNLSFSGEIRIARKHTLHVQRDLPHLIERAIGKLGTLRHTQERRFTTYKQHEMTDHQAHDLVICALDARVIPVTKIPDVLNEWRTSRHPEFSERNVWRLFNAFTETLKGSLDALPTRTTALHGILDSACGLQFSSKA